MQSDTEYRIEQKRCQDAWHQAHPGYWKEYRERHPEKAKRNRLLQNVRNRKRRGCDNHGADVDTSCYMTGQQMVSSVIAKMDASKSHEKSGSIRLPGQFWIVPLIAKMDALKVNIYEITRGYE